jgi:hypothetical protein
VQRDIPLRKEVWATHFFRVLMFEINDEKPQKKPNHADISANAEQCQIRQSLRKMREKLSIRRSAVGAVSNKTTGGCIHGKWHQYRTTNKRTGYRQWLQTS